LIGRGDGTFDHPPAPPTGDNPASAAVADLNGDGKEDLVTANLLSSDLSILLGNGDGTFTPGGSIRAGDLPGFVVAADFNGDNKQDLAVVNGFGGSGRSDLSILLGRGDGTFGAEQRLSLSANDLPYALAAGDFDAD